jgi:hypothetical protein
VLSFPRREGAKVSEGSLHGFDLSLSSLWGCGGCRADVFVDGRADGVVEHVAQVVGLQDVAQAVGLSSSQM